MNCGIFWKSRVEDYARHSSEHILLKGSWICLGCLCLLIMQDTEDGKKQLSEYFRRQLESIACE